MNKKKFIKKCFDRWTYRLGLRWWEVNITYYSEPDEIVHRFRTDGDKVCVAFTDVDWIYSRAYIHVNLPRLMDQDEGEIERIVVHELMHVLVNEMREDEMHHEERVVTQLTKAIFWTIADMGDKKQ